ncbi:MAG: thiamine-monophosphate kinase, partial [Desulfurococcaceae archaeon]
EYTLLGGEEYGVVMGVKPGGLNNLIKELEYFNIDYAVIGVAANTNPGVYVDNKEIQIKRYDQFKEWA